MISMQAKISQSKYFRNHVLHSVSYKLVTGRKYSVSQTFKTEMFTYHSEADLDVKILFCSVKTRPGG